MRLLKSIFDFYINSSIHVALAVCSLVWVTLLNFHIGIDINFILFVFFATITGYNFVKYFGLAKFHHRSLANWLKYIQIFSFFSFIALIYFMFKLKHLTIIYFGLLGIITFLYAIPFLPKKYLVDNTQSLRAVSGLKIYVISFVWSVTTVIIPLINEDYNINNDVVITSVQRFLYVIIVMLPFEIRDMKYDSLRLSTIPQQIGIERTKIIGSILVFVFFIIEFFKDTMWVNQVYILLAISLLMLGFLLISSINQRKYFSAFWVEGIPIVWAILTIANY